MSKIFCFVRNTDNNWLYTVALAEDGNCIANHTSSNMTFAKHDIGITSDWKHDIYKEHYPNGYELVWLETNEDFEREDFKQAWSLNAKLVLDELCSI
jgi:hypothetical protein